MNLFVNDDESDDNNNDNVRNNIVSDRIPPSSRSNNQTNRTTSFTASTNQIIHLADILTSITTIHNNAIIIIKKDGISIHATYNHITNVSATLDPNIFSLYKLIGDEEELQLGVDLNIISQCFNSVANNLTKKDDMNDGSTGGSNINCYISYNGLGSPLIIEFEDNLISEKLEFYTFYIDDDDIINSDISINYQNLAMELLVKSDILYNLLTDLNQIQTQDLFIYAASATTTSTHPQLHFISNGPIGTSKLIFPNEKTIIEKLLIHQGQSFIISKFNYITFYKIAKAVKLSSKAKILKDSMGNFNIQLLIKNPARLANSNGSLISFNMLELDQDNNEYMLEYILDELQQQPEDYESQLTRSRSNLGHPPLPPPQQQSVILPTQVIPQLRNPLSLDSFRTQGISQPPVHIQNAGVQVTATVYDHNKKRRRDEEEEDKDESIKNVGGAVEIPLFL
ncbi:RAD17 [[Candida] subhashii]|uniref:RAD17 n=1 Tax=[Candida] subhashii TaxID=561895 RepID=A0A8J5QUB2_9ASCO|nr:RAD17 [[Candida] subhashii]KAG7665122.1 RAD17 [[Candida] subhashii]